MASIPPSQRTPRGTSPRDPIAFGRFVVDVAAARLLCGGVEVALRPKAFDLLCVLARRPGELLTKDELLDAVWGTRHVSEGVVKTTVGELRSVLGDDPQQPTWIETVPRRGYRFVAQRNEASARTGPVESAAAGAPPTSMPPGLVGREVPLASLRYAWQEACAGRAGVLLVSGDAGVGKSALVKAFAGSLAEARVGHGQCVESFGQGEPYLPWLEALSSLADRIDDLPMLLRRHAPSWLANLPWMQTDEDRRGLIASGAASPDRMPREMASLLARLADRHPTLLLLEDLHWSDDASARLLDHLARRQLPARLLVVGTVRATDLQLSAHPLSDLRRELRVHGLAAEINLDGLDAKALRQLLGLWYPGATWSSTAIAALHEHTEGLPLFVRAVLDSLVADGALQAGSVDRWRLVDALPRPLPLPGTVAGLFEKHLSTLAPAQRELLEAAAVMGMEFDAVTLAAALDRDAGELRQRCDGLVRGGRWLRAAGVITTASGPSGRYRFGHALMHGQCYARCGPARRVELHRRVAQALLGLQATRAEELAAPLAWHHEQALDIDAALVQLRRSAGVARDRQAPRELLAISDRALALLDRMVQVDDATGHRQLVYEFAANKAAAIGYIDGSASPAVAEAAELAIRARAGWPVDEGLLNVYRTLWLHFVSVARFGAAMDLTEDLVALTDSGVTPGCRVQALGMLVFSAFKCGAFARAGEAIVEANALAPGVVAPNERYERFFAQQAHERALIGAMIDTLLGRMIAPAGALRHMPVAYYTPMGRVLNGVLCELWLAWCGDAQAVADDAQDVLALIRREDLTSGAVPHRLLSAWAQGVLDDAASALPHLREALAQVLDGAHLAERAAFLDLAADLAQRCGLLDEAAAHVDAAFIHAERTGERYALPLLWLRRASIARCRGDAQAQAAALEEVARVRGRMVSESSPGRDAPALRNRRGGAAVTLPSWPRS